MRVKYLKTLGITHTSLLPLERYINFVGYLTGSP
jgi:hypothetical protein